MRAYGQVGVRLFQQFDETTRLHAVEQQPAALLLPGRVQLVVRVSDKMRRLADHVEVCLAVEPRVRARGVIERIDDIDLASHACLLESATQSQSGALVSRAG